MKRTATAVRFAVAISIDANAQPSAIAVYQGLATVRPTR
jgi:hypothetical protein